MDRPYLYTVASEVLQGNRVVDRYTTPFGIRTVVFDKQKGFLLNGRYRKIHGVCLHTIWARWDRRSTAAPSSGNWRS